MNLKKMFVAIMMIVVVNPAIDAGTVIDAYLNAVSILNTASTHQSTVPDVIEGDRQLINEATILGTSPSQVFGAGLFSKVTINFLLTIQNSDYVSSKTTIIYDGNFSDGLQTDGFGADGAGRDLTIGFPFVSNNVSVGLLYLGVDEADISLTVYTDGGSAHQKVTKSIAGAPGSTIFVPLKFFYSDFDLLPVGPGNGFEDVSAIQLDIELPAIDPLALVAGFGPGGRSEISLFPFVSQVPTPGALPAGLLLMGFLGVRRRTRG